MSLYPRTSFITYGLSNKQRLYRSVIINGYQQAISHGAFTSLNRDVPYDMQLKLRSARPYYHIYRSKCMHDLQFDIDTEKRCLDKHGINPLIVIDTTEIDLYDWYQEIGYDMKKKHFNGVTLRRHILNCIKQEQLELPLEV